MRSAGLIDQWWPYPVRWYSLTTILDIAEYDEGVKGEFVLLGNLIGPDLVVVLVVLLVLMFGGPRLAKNLGVAKKEFEKAVKNKEAKSDETPNE